MGAVQGNGRPGSEAAAGATGSGRQEGTDPGGTDPAAETPHASGAGADRPGDEPAPAGPDERAAAAHGESREHDPGGVLPSTGTHPDGSARELPARGAPGAERSADGPSPGGPHGNGGAWEGAPDNRAQPATSQAPGPPPPSPAGSGGPWAPYPATQPYGAHPGAYPPGPHQPGPYPTGAYAPGAGQEWAHQPASYQRGPYPPGPYPPAQPGAGPYPAAQVSTPTRPRGPSWAAPSPHRTHRWGLGAYLVAEAVFLLVGALIGIFLVGDGPPSTGVLLVALAAPTLLAAGTALLITYWRGNGPRIDLGLVWSWRDLGLGLAFGFGGLALTIPASIIYVAIVGQDASSAVGDVFSGIRAGPVLAVLVLVIVVLVAPLCEEILYRGLLWGGLEKLAGRWVAFVVSTLLFALAHFEFTRTPLLFVVAIPIAIARLYTGRLLASIVAHQINNLLPGIVLVLGLLGVVPMA